MGGLDDIRTTRSRVERDMRALIEWAAAVRFTDIPAPVVRKAALIIADNMAAMVAARDEPEVRRVHDRLLSDGGRPQATVFRGGRERTDRISAALANSSNVGNSLPYAQQGKMHVLATTAAKRLRALPELPKIAELGYPGYEAVTWTGLGAPAASPKEINAKLGHELRQILRKRDVIDVIHKQELEPGGNTLEAFAVALKAESARYAALVRKINFRID